MTKKQQLQYWLCLCPGLQPYLPPRCHTVPHPSQTETPQDKTAYRLNPQRQTPTDSTLRMVPLKDWTLHRLDLPRIKLLPDWTAHNRLDPHKLKPAKNRSPQTGPPLHSKPLTDWSPRRLNPSQTKPLTNWSPHRLSPTHPTQAP